MTCNCSCSTSARQATDRELRSGSGEPPDGGAEAPTGGCHVRHVRVCSACAAGAGGECCSILLCGTVHSRMGMPNHREIENDQSDTARAGDGSGEHVPIRGSRGVFRRAAAAGRRGDASSSSDGPTPPATDLNQSIRDATAGPRAGLATFVTTNTLGC